MDQERRNSARLSRSAEVMMRSGQYRHAVPLVDMSECGCQTEVAEHVEPGERLFVTLPGLEPLEARVKWENGWRAGFGFERSIHPAVFDHLAARIG